MNTGFQRGGFRGGFGARGRGAGRGRGRGRGRRRFDKEKEWNPVTNLGRLVKAKKITKLEEIYTYGLPIREPEILDTLLGKDAIKEEVLGVMMVQKQTTAGQRTRFKAIVAVGDFKGHVGLGVKVAKETAMAIRGATAAAKLSIIPVRKGYWGNKIGTPHTVPCKVTGKCGSVSVRLIPAPRGTGLVGAAVPRRLLTMAGIEDVYTNSSGQTSTLANFAKATFAAIQKTFEFRTPDLWEIRPTMEDPYVEHSAFLHCTVQHL